MIDLNIYNMFWLSFLLPIITYIFKELKEYLYSLIYKSIYISTSSTEYNWVIKFITKRIRSVHNLALTDDRINKYFKNLNNYYCLPVGKYYITYNNNLYSIIMKEKAIIISTFSNNNWKILTNLIDEAEKEYNNTDINTKIGIRYYDSKHNEFILTKYLSARSLDTIILPKKTKSLIFDNLDLFYKKKSKYIELGITFKKGILFEGVPGAGKSTLLKSICSKYTLNSMYIVDLNIENILDKLKTIANNSMIVIEDIDRYFTEIRDNKNSKIIVSWQPQFNLAKLLNFLDGVDSPNNVLIVITTNNKNILPEVMFRSGRIDLVVNFTYCNKEQIKEYTDLFFENKENDDIKQKINNKLYNKQFTISQLQKYYLNYIDNIDLALENIHEFTESLPNLS